MGGPVGADHPGPVYREQHRQLLVHHVMHHLVVSPLQESRIDRHHRLQAVAGHARGNGNAVLFGNGHVKIPVRVFLFEAHQPGSFAHGRGHRHQALIPRRHIAYPIAEYLAVGRFRRLRRFRSCRLARLRVERFAHRMPFHRVFLGRTIALAFAGDDMQELRPLQLADIADGRQQGGQVMAVHGTDVVKTELLEQHARHYHALEVFFGALRYLQRPRHLGQDLPAPLPHRGVQLPGQQLGEAVRQGADVGRYRHVVVVQDHQQVRPGVAGMVQGLEGQARGQPAVAYDGDAFALAAGIAGRYGHAQRAADGGAGMAYAESIIRALVPLRKRRQPGVFPDGMQPVAAPGEDLVPVSLVAHVPDQPVLRRIVDIMQGNGQFHRAQAGSKMAGVTARPMQQEGAHLPGQRLQLIFRQAPQVRGGINSVQYRRLDLF